jgi:hypothetical protein
VVLTTFGEALSALLLFLLVAIPILCLWCFALFDLYMSGGPSWRKVGWLILIIILPFFGALIYLAFHGTEAAARVAVFAQEVEGIKQQPSS